MLTIAASLLFFSKCLVHSVLFIYINDHSSTCTTISCSLGKADALLGGEDQAPPAPERVSAMALLSYSTRREKWLMLGGLISAGVAGLAMPVWLLL